MLYRTSMRVHDTKVYVLYQTDENGHGTLTCSMFLYLSLFIACIFKLHLLLVCKMTSFLHAYLSLSLLHVSKFEFLLFTYNIKKLFV